VASDGGRGMFVGSISAGAESDMIELLGVASRRLTRGAGEVVLVFDV
jgi:hypothetical protein